MDEPRKRFAAMMSGLDIHYDLGAADVDKRHPLLGRRMPDLDLLTASGPLRVFALAARCAAGAAQPRRARRVRRHSVDKSRSVDRRGVHGCVGASGTRRGYRTCRRVDSARRLCGLGGRSSATRARRRANDLVRTGYGGVARRAACADRAAHGDSQFRGDPAGACNSVRARRTGSLSRTRDSTGSCQAHERGIGTHEPRRHGSRGLAGK